MTWCRYYSVRGNAYRALGQHQRAFFDYSAAARIAPTNALNYCNRAIALRKLKVAVVPSLVTRKCVCARSVVRLPLTKPLTMTGCVILFGCVSVVCGRNRSCLRLMRSDTVYTLLPPLQRYSEALADLSRASELESNPVFNFNRGLVLFDMGSYDGAATEFSAAIATDTLAYKVCVRLCS